MLISTQVFSRAMQGCMFELQASVGAAAGLSPAWMTAAAKHFAARLDMLCHIFLLQPRLIPEVFQQDLKRTEQLGMVKITFLIFERHNEHCMSEKAIYKYYVLLEPHLEMFYFWQVEDILALGVCVEQTKLLKVTSLHDCESFVGRVELLQPCLDRAFSQKYADLCSATCLQHLDSIRLFSQDAKQVSFVCVSGLFTSSALFRSLWHGLKVVASFIQHVLFKIEKDDQRLKELALKHCSLHLNVCYFLLSVFVFTWFSKASHILNLKWWTAASFLICLYQDSFTQS